MALDHPSGFSTEQAANILGTLNTILHTIIDGTEINLGEAEIISDRDRDQIWAWNQDWPEPVLECAHDKIARRIASQPAAPAISSYDGEYTYGQLDDLSSRLAHHLVSLGVGPDVIVPLCFQKTALAIITMLAVMKSGGGMVFLDPQHPQNRREDIMGQVKAKMVLTSAATQPLFAESDVDVFVVTTESLLNLPAFGQSPKTNVTPQNVLYVIFTSGSTGKPKGCIIEHASFCSGSLRHAEGSNLGTESRVAQFASYSFDVSILEIITGLIAGACICVPDEMSFGRGIAALLQEMRASWAFLTPSLVKLVSPGDVPDLKTLILGGEALSKADVEAWADHVLLINGYGPSECSIAAAANPGLTRDVDPANIGRGVGGICWIVDAEDYNKLVPIGAIGELLIEGPILARGYLDNPEKTAEVFVEPSQWPGVSYPGGNRRLYKTGDLARYNPDGTIHFIGRKDTQVKLRGQRIELGEIEHHLLSMHGHARHAMVLLPKIGPCKQKLVAILSLEQFLSHRPVDEIQVIQNDTVASQVSEVREHLSTLVPQYMVPTIWIVVEDMPLLHSGKMNRSKVGGWIAGFSPEMYNKIIGVASDGIDLVEDPRNLAETLIRKVYSRVLNLDVEQIAFDRSFLSLGGDSISAMQVAARCRTEGISVSIKDILRCKTLSELASRASQASASLLGAEDVFDTAFQLSPVQKLYFELFPEVPVKGTSTHYNQSFFLRLVHPTAAEALAKAIASVVGRHSMLRSRFEHTNGRWSQKVLEDVEGTYKFEIHEVAVFENIAPVMSATQRALDFMSGPMFAADLFNVANGEQFLFLAAHHLAIDLVSWRVIMQDLEAVLADDAELSAKPLPYQKWLELQSKYAEEFLQPQKVLPFTIPPPDIKYWAITGENTMKDTIERCFKISPDKTSLLLGDAPHRALRTEPIDILLSSIVYSFKQAFSDRGSPTIFREGHGREPWSDDIDISGTVGWFTTMFPLHVEAGKDIIETTRRVKDTRHSVPRNGWPYFASRYYNPEGMKAFGHHTQVEITFDYLGLYQQLERDDAVLRLASRTGLEGVEDVGSDVRRFMLVEITAEVLNGQMQLSFVYNRHMRDEAAITNWIDCCEQSLESALDQLTNMNTEFTLSDFPLLSLTYDSLQDLFERKLPSVGVTDLSVIEDVYPSSPMQRGLLLSQTIVPGSYEYHQLVRATPQQGTKIDLDRLQSAWSKVVQRHPVLRTLFVPSVDGEGFYDQVVLRTLTPRVVRLTCAEDEVEDVLQRQPAIKFVGPESPHRLSICETTAGQIFIKLELNHAIIDGGSLPLILRDLSLAYDSELPTVSGPLYSNYLSYLQEIPADSALDYWKMYLMDVQPCYFPTLERTTEPRELQMINLDLQIPQLQLRNFGEKHGVTLSNIIQVAWGLVLRCYTGLEDVCFGYLSSGRDAPVAGIDDAVGAFLTILVCRLDLKGQTQISKILDTVQDDFTRSLPNQYCSLADIQHALKLGGRPLFNTIVSFHKNSLEDGVQSKEIQFTKVSEHDPTEVSPISFNLPWESPNHVHSMIFQ